MGLDEGTMTLKSALQRAQQLVQRWSQETVKGSWLDQPTILELEVRDLAHICATLSFELFELKESMKREPYICDHLWMTVVCSSMKDGEFDICRKCGESRFR